MKLSPKFAVLSRLYDESVELDIEICLTKLRYEIRRYEEQKLMDEVDVVDNVDYTNKTNKKNLNLMKL